MIGDFQAMYSRLPAFIIGFHGCDESVANRVVRGKEILRASRNEYDWLGHGIYFWENSYSRALDHAVSIMSRPERGRMAITKPAVLGAVIDLGYCLNLMDSEFLSYLRTSYESLKVYAEQAGQNLPVNSEAPGSGNDLLLRRLDCAVIEFLCKQRDATQGKREFDSVRGLFFEGEDLYPNAGFKAKNHIQICVRNSNCIKGYFLPRSPDQNLRIP
jgi:hypothetical protein